MDHLPEALINVDTPLFTENVRAKCMSNPLYDVVLEKIVGIRSTGRSRCGKILDEGTKPKRDRTGDCEFPENRK